MIKPKFKLKFILVAVVKYQLEFYTMNAEKGKQRINPLTLSNYLEWKDLMLAVLEIEECVQVEENNDELIINFIKEKKQKARGLIITHLDMTNLVLVKSIRDPSTIWSTLKDYHGNTIRAMKMRIQSEYGSFKYIEGEDIQKYITRFEHICAKWISVGNTLSSEDKALKFLQGYKSRNSTLVTILMNNNKTFNYGNTLAAVLENENQETTSEVKTEVNLKTNQEKKVIKCFFCKKKGHKANKCYKKHPELKPKHYNNTYSNNNNNNNDNQNYYLFATNEDIIKRNNTNNWILDSGCSIHMTGNKEDLINARKCNSNIKVADGRKLKSNLKGDLIRITEAGMKIKIQDLLQIEVSPMLIIVSENCRMLS